MSGEPLLADGHSNAGRDASTERTARGFDARDPMVFGVPGRFAVQLAEAADIIKRDRGLAEALVFSIDRLRLRKMKRGPEKHAGVTIGQDESVTVWPNWISWIEIHYPIPKGIDERSECHRSARVAGLGRLNRVNGQGANGVDTQLVEFRAIESVLAVVAHITSSALPFQS